MKIKIMYPNTRGNIELTKEELEKLLNEAYSEGYSDGCRTLTTTPYVTWNTTEPKYTLTTNSSDCTASGCVATLNSLGVSVTNANGEYKSTETALKEVASKWDGLNDVQKTYAAAAVTGTRSTEDLT